MLIYCELILSIKTKNREKFYVLALQPALILYYKALSIFYSWRSIKVSCTLTSVGKIGYIRLTVTAIITA